jgi:anion-transporting  ArsA/GET3 family ATPase
MKNLFDKRVVFVAGKGGTGKTTLTCALAIAAAEGGKRVLVVETRENDALAPLFGRERLADKPSPLGENIWGARINPKRVLEEYVRKYVTIPFVAQQITGSRVFDHLASATPGLKEVMTLAEIWRFEKRKDPESDKPLYELIIVDSPATGHGLSLLRVPTTLVSMLQTGPIAEQTRWVREMLRDPERTGILVATLPEELPVNEALEFCRKAENDLDMRVEAVVANMVYPVVFNPEEISVIEGLEGNARSPTIEAAKRQINRRRVQESHLERLLNEGEHPVIRIPYYYTNNLDGEQIGDIARRLKAEPI